MHYLSNRTAHYGGQLRKGRRRWRKDSEIASYRMIGRWHGRRVSATVMVAAVKTWALIDCDSEETPELKQTHKEVCPRLRIWLRLHYASFQDTVGRMGCKCTTAHTWKLPKEQVRTFLCRRAFQEATSVADVCPRVWRGSTNTWQVKAEGPWVWGHTGLHSLFQEQT